MKHLTCALALAALLGAAPPAFAQDPNPTAADPATTATSTDAASDTTPYDGSDTTTEDGMAPDATLPATTGADEPNATGVEGTSSADSAAAMTPGGVTAGASDDAADEDGRRNHFPWGLLGLLGLFGLLGRKRDRYDDRPGAPR